MKNMKKVLYLMLTSMMVLCMMTNIQAKTSTKTKALKAYSALLAKKTLWVGDYYGEPIYFKTVDLNNDKIPELLVDNENGNEGDGYCGYYTYVNGKAKFLMSANDITYAYVKGKKAYIYWDHYKMGYDQEEWLTFNGKTLIFSYYHCHNVDKNKHEYKKGKKKITKSAYKKAVKSMKKNAKIVGFDNKMHLNTSANRRKYLK